MTQENYYKQQLYQMFDMVENIIEFESEYLENSKLAFKVFSDFQKNLIPRYEIPNEYHPSGACLPGLNRLFVDVEGTFYPCEKVSGNSEISKIGNVYSGFDYSKIETLLNLGQISEHECSTCWCSQFCTCCLKFVDGLSSLSKDKKLRECTVIKKRVLQTMSEFIIYRAAEKIYQGENNECSINAVSL